MKCNNQECPICLVEAKGRDCTKHRDTSEATPRGYKCRTCLLYVREDAMVRFVRTCPGASGENAHEWVRANPTDDVRPRTSDDPLCASCGDPWSKHGPYVKSHAFECDEDHDAAGKPCPKRGSAEAPTVTTSADEYRRVGAILRPKALAWVNDEHREDETGHDRIASVVALLFDVWSLARADQFLAAQGRESAPTACSYCDEATPVACVKCLRQQLAEAVDHYIDDNGHGHCFGCLHGGGVSACPGVPSDSSREGQEGGGSQ